MPPDAGRHGRRQYVRRRHHVHSCCSCNSNNIQHTRTHARTSSSFLQLPSLLFQSHCCIIVFTASASSSTTWLWHYILADAKCPMSYRATFYVVHLQQQQQHRNRTLRFPWQISISDCVSDIDGGAHNSCSTVASSFCSFLANRLPLLLLLLLP